MVKDLLRFMFSITKLTVRLLVPRPSRENSPVVAPKAGKAAAAMKKSARNRALPMSALVYFLRIMAMMSVPPVEAPTLNSTAAPTEGSSTPKISSSRG